VAEGRARSGTCRFARCGAAAVRWRKPSQKFVGRDDGVPEVPAQTKAAVVGSIDGLAVDT